MLRAIAGFASLFLLVAAFVFRPAYVQSRMKEAADRTRTEMKERCDAFVKDGALKQKMAELARLRSGLTGLEDEYRHAKSNRAAPEQLQELACRYATLIKETRVALDEARQRLDGFRHDLDPLSKKLSDLRLKETGGGRQASSQQLEQWRNAVSADMAFVMATVEEEIAKPLSDIDGKVKDVELRCQQAIKLKACTVTDDVRRYELQSASAEYLEINCRR